MIAVVVIIDCIVIIVDMPETCYSGFKRNEHDYYIDCVNKIAVFEKKNITTISNGRYRQQINQCVA